MLFTTDTESQLRALPQIRTLCDTCKGNASVCQNLDSLERAPGCIAFTDSGRVRLELLQAQQDARQPWQPKA